MLMDMMGKFNPSIWVMITDHADDDSGDPFITPTLSDTVENVG
jgi:hypothetical protein